MGDQRGKTTYTAAERRLLRHRARLEAQYIVEQLLAAPGAHLPYTGGYELENVFTDPETGLPLLIGPEVVQQAVRDGLPMVTEITRWQGESNGPPLPFNAQMLGAYRAQMSRHLTAVQSIAASRGGQISLMGILMSLMPGHVCADAVTPGKPRYPALQANLKQLYRPVRFSGGELHFRTEDIWLAGAFSSFQTHRTVWPHELVRYINAAQLAAALLVATCGGSTHLFGKHVAAEARLPLWTALFRGRPTLGPCVTMPDGTRTWPSTPQQVFEYCLQPQFKMVLAELTDSPVEQLQHWSCARSQSHAWVNPEVHVNTGQFGYEFRPLPVYPTVDDQLINLTQVEVIVTALALHIDDWIAAGFPYEDAVENLRVAAEEGLEAKLSWPNASGRPELRPVTDIVLRLLDQEASTALSVLGWDSTAEAFLDQAFSRILTGRTAARWTADAAATIGGNTPAEKWGRITKIHAGPGYSDYGQGLPVHTWPQAIASPLAA